MTYLYLIPPATEENGDLFPNDGTAVLLGVTDSGHRKCLSSSEIAGVNIVGQWDNDGQLQFVDIATYTEYFAAFMNTIEGFATDKQDVPHWQGHSMRKMQQVPAENTLDTYPPNRQPFIVTMKRYRETSGGWPGWYWLFMVEFVDTNRPPQNRTVGIYDADWNYLYTVGALAKENIPVGVDEDGNPVYEEHWVGRCPPGRQTTTPETIYYALLHGSAQEGKMVLEADRMNRHDFYWEYTEVDQSDPAPPWVDIDGDGKPDDILAGEFGEVLVTEDDDSINIDLDGDGIADVVVPK